MTDLITTAVLMLGGQGKRLHPYTDDIPKPMMDINGAPLLKLIVEKLYYEGIRRFFFSVNYLHNVIEEYFGDGSEFGVEIKYIKEPFQMGTVGSVALISELDVPFLLMNGDIYTEMDFRDFFVSFWKNRPDLQIAYKRKKTKFNYGVLTLENDIVLRWNEKPESEYDISCGIYVFDPGVIEYIPKPHFVTMNYLVEQLIQSDRKVIRGYKIPDGVPWFDIGTVSDYKNFLEHMLRNE